MSFWRIFYYFYPSLLYYGVYHKLHVSYYKVKEVQRDNGNVIELVLNYQKEKYLKPKGGQFIFMATSFSKFDE